MKDIGGVITAWPPQFGDNFGGLSAVRFDAATYVAVANAAQIDNTLPVHPDRTNSYFYVLAPEDAQADSPQTMTAWQRFLNAGFTYRDEAKQVVAEAAKKAGGALEFGFGKVALGVGIAVVVLAWFELRRR
jgi:hypothetical protein